MLNVNKKKAAPKEQDSAVPQSMSALIYKDANEHMKHGYGVGMKRHNSMSVQEAESQLMQ